MVFSRHSRGKDQKMTKKKLRSGLGNELGQQQPIPPDLDTIITQLKDIGTQKLPVGVRKKLASLVRFLQTALRQNGPRPKSRPSSPVANPKDPASVELERQLGVVRDRVRGVASHGLPGFYLYGRAGTSKTYTVRTTLASLNCEYVYHAGHLTPIGLFELLEENPTKVIVLDDVASIFDQPKALSILLAALGKQPDGSRIVKYKRQGRTIRVAFSGGIIAISNLELHGNAVVDALRSRVCQWALKTSHL
jgi:hypothetical protein